MGGVAFATPPISNGLSRCSFLLLAVPINELRYFFQSGSSILQALAMGAAPVATEFVRILSFPPGASYLASDGAHDGVDF